jgi:hypothetical protein
VRHTALAQERRMFRMLFFVDVNALTTEHIPGQHGDQGTQQRCCLVTQCQPARRMCKRKYHLKTPSSLVGVFRRRDWRKQTRGRFKIRGRYRVAGQVLNQPSSIFLMVPACSLR